MKRIILSLAFLVTFTGLQSQTFTDLSERVQTLENRQDSAGRYMKAYRFQMNRGNLKIGLGLGCFAMGIPTLVSEKSMVKPLGFVSCAYGAGLLIAGLVQKQMAGADLKKASLILSPTGAMLTLRF